MTPADRERVTARFAAYAADGTRYVVVEFQTVHRWGSSSDFQSAYEWPGVPQYRLFDGTPVEKIGRDLYSFRHATGALIELNTEKPRAPED